VNLGRFYLVQYLSVAGARDQGNYGAEKGGSDVDNSSGVCNLKSGGGEKEWDVGLGEEDGGKAKNMQGTS
jgi:hypothetical protein